MIGTSVMKELTTLDSEFTESKEKKENNFPRPRNFDFTCVHVNVYGCLKWFEKPIWLIKIKFSDITDMFHKYRSRSLKVFCKNCAHKSFTKFTRKHLCRILLLKKQQATGWLRRDSVKSVFLVQNF